MSLFHLPASVIPYTPPSSVVKMGTWTLFRRQLWWTGQIQKSEQHIYHVVSGWWTSWSSCFIQLNNLFFYFLLVWLARNFVCVCVVCSYPVEPLRFDLAEIELNRLRAVSANFLSSLAASSSASEEKSKDLAADAGLVGLGRVRSRVLRVRRARSFFSGFPWWIPSSNE